MNATPTTSARPSPTARSAQPRTGDAELREPAERGRTELASRVVEKVAAQAATEVAHVGGLQRHVAGRAVGNPAVRGNAEIYGHLVGLRIELAVDYPHSVRAVTRAARAHVVFTVQRLCGLRVDHLDITVAVLRRPDAEGSRVQ